MPDEDFYSWYLEYSEDDRVKSWENNEDSAEYRKRMGRSNFALEMNKETTYREYSSLTSVIYPTRLVTVLKAMKKGFILKLTRRIWVRKRNFQCVCDVKFDIGRIVRLHTGQITNRLKYLFSYNFRKMWESLFANNVWHPMMRGPAIWHSRISRV